MQNRILDREDRPLLALTVGDPTGIGPEIIVKAVMDPSVHRESRLVAIGPPTALRLAIERSNLPLTLIEVAHPSEVGAWTVDAPSHALFCIPKGPNHWSSVSPSPNPLGGQAAYEALVYATNLALNGDIDGLVTAPLHKGALHMAGHDWPGHTELLASLCQVLDYAMMLYLPPRELDGLAPKHSRLSELGPVGLGVVHVTLHMAMREIFEKITVPNIVEKIELARFAFDRIRRSVGISTPPRIAVAALNPHGGEDGLFGREEIDTIRPAVLEARKNGTQVDGPLPVDTLMPKAVAGEYDAVIAMYHDQGHIALKLLDMFDAVNITLGLPIVRTSVAHGTAHDIAWQDLAKATGMVQAIKTAARLSGVQNEQTART